MDALHHPSRSSLDEDEAAFLASIGLKWPVVAAAPPGADRGPRGVAPTREALALAAGGGRRDEGRAAAEGGKDPRDRRLLRAKANCGLSECASPEGVALNFHFHVETTSAVQQDRTETLNAAAEAYLAPVERRCLT